MLSNSRFLLQNTRSISKTACLLRPLSTKTPEKDPRPSAAVAAEYFNRPGPWDDKNLRPLIEANKVWADRMEKDNPEMFEDIRKGHSPKILWIGCSDARVPANEIIGEPAGSVFIHRNIANQVVNTDVNCLSVIQYAVDVLKVKHIIVCGHYDCGGIRASMENTDHRSPLVNWLRNIRDIYRIYRVELDAIEDPIARQRRLVELNTIEQCLNVYKTECVQRKRITTFHEKRKEGSKLKFSEPRIHGMVYEPGTGKIKKLDVDFREYIHELRSIYDLYSVERGGDSSNKQS